MNRKRPQLLAGLLLILLLAAAGASYHFFHSPGYDLVPVRRGEIVEAVYGLGTVKTPRQYEVSSGIAATVVHVYVKEGDFVKVGAPLIKLDPSVIFKSPLDGIVSLVDAHDEELVAPQKPILRVEDLSDRYIEVALEQQGILRVATGQKAIVLFESVRGEKFDGLVTAVYSRDQEFLAHIQVAGLRENVLPGMTADVAIEVSRHKDTLLVPLSAVHNGQVLVERGGKRQKLPVKVGAIDGASAEILEGDVNAGDSVVVVRKKPK